MMKTLRVRRRKLDLNQYTYRVAQPADVALTVEGPTSVYEEGSDAPAIVYCPIKEPLSDLVGALERIQYARDFRSKGLPTNSRIFGYAPRSTLRKDFCSTTSLAAEFPKEHAIICEGVHVANRYYAQWNPSLHDKHRRMTRSNVRPEWHLEESVFTSGIVNKNNPLRYHFDTGNFKGVWSAMMVFKKDVQGGGLNVPEYDLSLACADHTLVMFDGQNLLHGVTPFSLLNRRGYRYSIVYYSLRQMWNCLPPGEELARIRKLKTQRELKRAGL